ncbi:hypothetical protein Tco_1488721, partial [Tanacetum coccineum]
MGGCEDGGRWGGGDGVWLRAAAAVDDEGVSNGDDDETKVMKDVMGMKMAPFLNVQKTFDRSSSSLGLHGDDAPFLNVQKTFDRSRSSLGLHGDDVSSGLVLHQMMSDHNSSDLTPQQKEMSVESVSSGLVPQGQKASDFDNSDPVSPRQNVVPTAEKTDSSHQG